MGFFIMIDTKTLGAAAGIQRQDVIDRSADRVIPSWAKAVIVGRFKRGRMDKPFIVTANNYQALLGDDPFNPSYTVVDDAFIAGASEVMVMRIGNPLLIGKPPIDVPVDPPKPINKPASVAINGLAKVGETLTATIIDDDGLPKDIAYQWMAGGVQVGTASVYQVSEADKGKRLSLQVVFTDKKGFIESAISDVTEPVKALNKPAIVTIKGNLKTDEILISTVKDANGMPSTGNISYQWMAGGVQVGTASTYKIKSNDAGKIISLQVAFTDNEGFAETATATAGAPVTAVNKPAGVTIYGTVKVGETLTGVITDANGVPSEVSYQWMADGVEVGSVSSYRLSEADKGKRLSLTARFVDGDGFTENATSIPTEPVKAINKPASVTINGAAKVGERLTAIITDDNGVSDTVIYRWMANGVTINTGGSHVLTENDKGKVITVRVSFTDNDGFTETVTSAGTEPVEALNKAASVIIKGFVEVDEILTAGITDANGVPSNVTYQWMVDNVVIGTENSYRLTDSEKGKQVSLRVTFIDRDGFLEEATSALTAPVQATNRRAAVIIKGVTKVGETLTAVITDGNGVSSSITHKWMAGGVQVGMAASYTLTEADKGKRIFLNISFTDNDGFEEAATSALTAPVAALNYPASVIVEGVMKVGEVLTAIVSDPNGIASDIAYQWMTNNIEVGTEASYTLTEADKGGIVSLYVAFIDNDGFGESAISADSDPVQPLNKPASVVINGVTMVGETLTAAITDDNGIPTDIAYQWLADDLEAGTADSYLLTEADEGKIMALRVTFIDNDGFEESVISAQTSPVRPNNKPASVAINGLAKVGEVLTVTIVDDNGVPSDIAYQWMADGIEVGATDSYAPSEADAGKVISVRVTFIDNDGFEESVISAAGEPVAPVEPPPVEPVEPPIVE